MHFDSRDVANREDDSLDHFGENPVFHFLFTRPKVIQAPATVTAPEGARAAQGQAGDDGHSSSPIVPRKVIETINPYCLPASEEVVM